ncbi:efflux RND transporter periplasmic adaptor subunit [Cysteiniphilum litorale]|uniref:efflux RND transporter periplasmic adaptor subunit n=1 Tax=Cysteiniphilum litorale TaxID=2056700 RepID=UPI003F880B00
MQEEITKNKHVKLKNLGLIVLGGVIGFAIFYALPLGQSKQSNKDNVDQKAKKPLYWVAPMDPNYKRDQPGKSPMGMDLVPVYAESFTASGVKISPEVMNNIGVQVEPVKYRSLRINIDALGVIKENDNYVEHVHTYENGWIRKLQVAEVGKEVTKGQLIAQIYSPKLLEAEQEFVLALQSKSVATNSETSQYNDQTDYINAARLKLRALGISDEQIARIEKNKKADVLIDIYAPISGVVSELEAKEGMYVTPDKNIMSIVDLSTVWLSAEVFPSQVQYLNIGDEISGKINGTNEISKGKLTFISPTIDPVTRTVTIRATLDNKDQLLKPNLYMDVSILSKKLAKSLTVPSSAIIRLKDLNYVILENEQGQFSAQEVKLGLEANGYTQILAGLTVNDNIVTSSLFLIDSESNVQASLKRLNANHKSQTKMDKMSNQSKSSLYQGMGVVQKIDKEKHVIILSHEPIKALNWPAMTMPFSVSNKVDLDELKPSERIHFEFEKQANDYVITKISVH